MIEYLITMVAKCDGCGRQLNTATLDRPAEIERTRWAWMTEWKKRGGMTRDRKYKKPLIFCQPCADGTACINSPAAGGPGLLDPADLHILRHSLGIDDSGEGAPYRNYFATDPDTEDGKHCRSLVTVGFMLDHGPKASCGGMHMYSVTALGKDTVAIAMPPQPELSDSAKRYRRYLDADSGLSFREWLKTPYGK